MHFNEPPHRRWPPLAATPLQPRPQDCRLGNAAAARAATLRTEPITYATQMFFVANEMQRKHVSLHSRCNEGKLGDWNSIDSFWKGLTIVGFERKRRELIPREAFREAIANALVHRRWDAGGSINVRMFADRIEVTSPGGLPGGIAEEDYLSGGLSIARNPILANIFFRLGYIERFGTGIPRIVEAYEPLLGSPSFSVKSSSITVVLPVGNPGNLSDDETAILKAVPKGVLRSRAQIESSTGMSKDKTVRLLGDLQEKGLIRKSGAGRSTRYSRL